MCQKYDIILHLRHIKPRHPVYYLETVHSMLKSPKGPLILKSSFTGGIRQNHCISTSVVLDPFFNTHMLITPFLSSSFNPPFPSIVITTAFSYPLRQLAINQKNRTTKQSINPGPPIFLKGHPKKKFKCDENLVN